MTKQLRLGAVTLAITSSRQRIRVELGLGKFVIIIEVQTQALRVPTHRLGAIQNSPPFGGLKSSFP